MGVPAEQGFKPPVGVNQGGGKAWGRGLGRSLHGWTVPPVLREGQGSEGSRGASRCVSSMDPRVW